MPEQLKDIVMVNSVMLTCNYSLLLQFVLSFADRWIYAQIGGWFHKDISDWSVVLGLPCFV